jgi:hypothetical protein
MIGGHFAVDHIGPTAYTGIRQRAMARPKDYLAIVERLALASNAQQLSSSYVPFVIDLLEPSAKTEATALAKKLLPVYQRAAQQGGGDPYRGQRLADRIRELERLAK